MIKTFILFQSEGAIPMNLIFMAAFFGIFYFFFIRPQMKKQKETANFINEIKKGDKVVTNGGIHAKVLNVKENTVILEVDSIKMTVEKTMINVDYSKIIQAPKK